jgi:hypothetical protein
MNCSPTSTSAALQRADCERVVSRIDTISFAAHFPPLAYSPGMSTFQPPGLAPLRVYRTVCRALLACMLPTVAIAQEGSQVSVNLNQLTNGRRCFTVHTVFATTIYTGASDPAKARENRSDTVDSICVSTGRLR